MVEWSLDRWDTRERFVPVLEDHARDTEGLPDSVRADLRRKAEQYLVRSVHLFRLVDDVGTFYLPRSQSIGGTTRRSTYVPAIPESARRLFIEWYGWSTEVPLGETLAEPETD